MEFEWGIRNEKSSKDSLRHLKNLFPFHLPSLVSLVAYRSRSIIDAPADAPPETSARTPCPQVSQWHPHVAKRSSKWPSARPPCPQVPQWHPRVAKGSSNRHFGTDTLPTDISVASRRGKGGLLSGLWHGHPVHRYLSGIPAWRRGLLSGLRHGHLAHRYLSGIPAWRRGCV